MRSKFPGYYKPNETEFEALWADAIIVLDTNVLLDLYRYTDTTVDLLLSIIDKYKDRIWIPFQTSLEYHNNLNETISSQINSYSKTIKTLEDFKKQLDAKKSHPFLAQNLHDEINSFCSKFDDELLKKKEDVEKLIIENPIKEKVAEALDNSVGDDFTAENLELIYNEGAERYSKSTPPGFKDCKKPTNREKYGDLIIWKEIIAKSKETDKPILFVTSDVKEDWFYIHHGKTIGPRPELVHEFRKETNKLCYIYPTPKFLEYANKYLELDTQVEKEVLDEINSIINEQRLEREQMYNSSQNSISTTNFNSTNGQNHTIAKPNEDQLIPNNTGSLEKKADNKL